MNTIRLIVPTDESINIGEKDCIESKKLVYCGNTIIGYAVKYDSLFLYIDVFEKYAYSFYKLIFNGYEVVPVLNDGIIIGYSVKRGKNLQ